MDTFYLVSIITRAHSSGYENKWQQLFSTAEKACEYARKNYMEEYADFDDDDLDRYDEDFLFPNNETATNLFNSDKLIKEKTIEFAPYNNNHCIVLFEINVYMLKVDDE